MADLVISVRNLTREYLMGTEVVYALRGASLDTPTSGEYWLSGQRVESDRLSQGKAA